MDWLTNQVARSRAWAFNRWLSASGSEVFTEAAEETAEILERALANTTGALKHDQTTTVKRLRVGNSNLILKRYNARNSWHRVKRALRKSRARRCWCMSYHFQRAGLNVAEPIMMYEKRTGPFRGDAYLVNGFLPGKELLSLLPAMPSEQQLQVKHAIESAFNSMREHKISHGDMKASNLLWVNGQLYFVDLDAARKHWFRFTWRHSHKKDRRRFLKNWRNQPSLRTLFED